MMIGQTHLSISSRPVKRENPAYAGLPQSSLGYRQHLFSEITAGAADAGAIFPTLGDKAAVVASGNVVEVSAIGSLCGQLRIKQDVFLVVEIGSGIDARK